MNERRFFDIAKKILGNNCNKILSIDITLDQYEVFSVDDFEWKKKSSECGSDKISEWFQWFAGSPFCHEADRERFRQFTELNHLNALLERTNYAPASLVYRRKFDLSEKTYSNVSMDIYPEVTEDGHVTAFLFVRNLNYELQRNYETLEYGLNREQLRAEAKTVLVVEDNELNREILDELLSDDFTLLFAENGAVGLELLQRYINEISVVLLDVYMPVLNGYEFLKIVKKDPFLSQIPVVVATAEYNLLEEQRCLKLGASDFVAKPYQPEIIKKRIERIINLRESNATLQLLQTDKQTGLYTPQAFYHYAKQSIDRADNKAMAVTIIEVERYNIINRLYGENAGKQLVRDISGVLKEYMCSAKVHGRLGAARFLLLNRCMSLNEMDLWINGLFSKLQDSCSYKEVTFKAGIYNEVDKTLPISKICARATSALNSISPYFENRYAMFNVLQEEKERCLAIMESDMLDAYHNEQFKVYYQPKHDTNTGKLVGAEALIRWVHPKLGFLSPGEFIPLFERNGFIAYADRYVMKKTCEHLKSWIDEGINPVPVSVNISRCNCNREEFVDTLLNELKRNRIDPKLLHLEVTETFFGNYAEEIVRFIQRIKTAGLAIELDDFGSGYSSLTMLTSVPFDVLKMDKSFLEDLENEKTQKTIKTCINLAHSLGMNTISEGVETGEQLELLKRYGCDWIQGFYFSKPMPEADFREYMIRHMHADDNSI